MKYYSARNAAEKCGLTYQGLRYYRERYSVGTRIGGVTVYTQGDIDRIKAMRRKSTNKNRRN